MKNQINIQQTESGHEYFYIYEVRAKKFNGEVITHRFLSEKKANEVREFAMKFYNELYTSIWIFKQIVWC